MIYALLAWEFFKIGLFAIGGGLVTVPFLFDLAQKYPWFSTQELTDMIAVSQSVPGAVGINMATYAGFTTAGFAGGLVAVLSEVLPSMIVIYIIARLLNRWHENKYVSAILEGIRPAVLALILYAGWSITAQTITNWQTLGLLVILVLAMRLYKISPIYYIVLSAFIGVVLHLI